MKLFTPKIEHLGKIKSVLVTTGNYLEFQKLNLANAKEIPELPKDRDATPEEYLAVSEAEYKSVKRTVDFLVNTLKLTQKQKQALLDNYDNEGLGVVFQYVGLGLQGVSEKKAKEVFEEALNGEGPKEK